MHGKFLIKSSNSCNDTHRKCEREIIRKVFLLLCVQMTNENAKTEN